MTVIDIKSITQFNDIILKTGKKTIVCDFYATWCKPCMQFGPAFDKLSAKYDKQITYLKVDISNSDLQDLQDDYEIMTLPTFIIFNKGSLTTPSSSSNRITGVKEHILSAKLDILDNGIAIDMEF